MEKIKKTGHFLATKMKSKPQIGIILGSGLGSLVQHLQIEKEIPYHEIPNFPVSTVKGHRGSLIFGKMNDVDVMVCSGRFHYYEGYTMQEVTFPIQVMKELGIKKLIVSNASGGMNPTFKVGDIMLIKDHINMFPTNPLIGPNDDTMGPRFLDMSEPYSKKMLNIAFECAKELNIHVQSGIYVGVTGPCFETPAEYRMFHIIGGDAVGMSTVPETIVARHRGMEVFGLSVITDLGIVGQVENVSHEEVLKAAQIAGPKMVALVAEMLPRI
ncbi:MAG: purine-nucleoside phosphorylase [Bacteroidetes bacterium]|nr:purine-nucleoside phosphorylase [Bacteroidota bacterium]MCL2302724.1 purine-nucleoside phosphorylase [Lentimicrobiaceae bacterium]